MTGKKLVFIAVLLCLGKRCELRCTVGECPLQGWVKLGGHSCFKIYPTLKKNWAQAEAICQVIGRGSHLVRLRSNEESQAIKNELDLLAVAERPNSPLWIGLNDIEQELNRTWVGHQYEENMFENIEYEFQNYEELLLNCGAFSLSSPETWFFLPCSDKNGFICQQPLAQL